MKVGQTSQALLLRQPMLGRLRELASTRGPREPVSMRRQKAVGSIVNMVRAGSMERQEKEKEKNRANTSVGKTPGIRYGTD